MTRGMELLRWLRKNGPATLRQIQDAGFLNFNPAARTRMVNFGSIRKYEMANPDSEGRYSRFVITVYEATDKDYPDRRGEKSSFKLPEDKREAIVIARAVTVLTRRGYTVMPPRSPETKEN